MSAAPRRAGDGFTFVEVLAALLFLAVVVPAIVAALSLANRAAEITERGTTAGQLAENKLNELLVGSAWQNPPAIQGDCGPAFPGYRWQLTQSAWTADAAHPLTQLRVDVFFKVQGVERSVALTTLVNSLSAAGANTGGGQP